MVERAYLIAAILASNSSRRLPLVPIDAATDACANDVESFGRSAVNELSCTGTIAEESLQAPIAGRGNKDKRRIQERAFTPPPVLQQPSW